MRAAVDYCSLHYVCRLSSHVNIGMFENYRRKPLPIIILNTIHIDAYCFINPDEISAELNKYYLNYISQHCSTRVRKIP